MGLESLKDMKPNPFSAIRQELSNMSDVVNLSSGDPDFRTPSHIVEAAYKSLNEGVTHYTPTNGLPELREEIARYYSNRLLTTELPLYSSPITVI